MREKILTSELSNGDTRNSLLLQAEQRLEEVFAQESKAGIRRVINATGVVLHTNLGRAPLSQAARAAVATRQRGTAPSNTNRLGITRATWRTG